MAVGWGRELKLSPQLMILVVVIELWMLTLCSFSIAGLALFLHSRRLVDSTMAAGVLFSLMGVSNRLCNVDCKC